MTSVTLPEGNDPKEREAPRNDVRTVQYAEKSTVREIPGPPKRYYGSWTGNKDGACTGGGFGSSIYDNGHILTEERCANGTMIIKIESPN